MVYMPKTYNEKMIWEILHENPKGIGKRDLERQSGVNSSSTQKILTKLSKLNEIDYPLSQRGKKSLIKISDVRNSQLFKKIKKFTKSIEDAWETYGEGIIFELKDGTTIQAGIDDQAAEHYLLRANFCPPSARPTVNGQHSYDWENCRYQSTIHEQSIDIYGYGAGRLTSVKKVL